VQIKARIPKGFSPIEGKRGRRVRRRCSEERGNGMRRAPLPERTQSLFRIERLYRQRGNRKGRKVGESWAGIGKEGQGQPKTSPSPWSVPFSEAPRHREGEGLHQEPIGVSGIEGERNGTPFPAEGMGGTGIRWK